MIAALVAGLPFASARSSELIGDLEVTPPPFWFRKRVGDSVVFVTPPATAVPCLVSVSGRRASRGDARLDAMDDWTPFLGSRATAQSLHIVTTPLSGPWSAAVAVTNNPNLRVQMATFTGLGRTQYVLAAARPGACELEIGAFLDHVKPSARAVPMDLGTPRPIRDNPLSALQTPSPLPASAGAAASFGGPASDVIGLWHGMASLSVPRLDGKGLEVRVGAQYLLLMPDGTYTSDIPRDGIDASTLSRGSIYQRGRYRVQDGAIELLSMAPGARPVLMPLANGVLHSPNGDLQRRPSTEGAKLQGTFSRTPGGASITFQADGRFVDQGALGSIPIAGQSRGPTAPRSGHYEVSNHSVSFTYDSGGGVRYTLFYAEPTGINIGNVRLERR
jgi:hypothetical protein